MKWTRYLPFLEVFLLANCGTTKHIPELDSRNDTTYSAHSVPLCGVNYSFTGSIYWKHRVPHYKLSVAPPNRPPRNIKIGAIPDFEPRTTLLLALTQTLHNTDILVPCNGQSGQNYITLNTLAETLTAEPFPYTRDKEVAVLVLDDNNVLRLVQEASSKRYQLVDVTPMGPVILLDYNNANNRYELSTANLNPFVLAHFDGFLKVYFKLPPTTVRPILFLVPNGPPPAGYELILQNPEGNPDYARTNVLVSLDIGKKISQDPAPTDPQVNVPALGNIQLRKMIDPNSHPKPPVQNPPIPHANP